MKGEILLDTGPLVASLDSRDDDQEWAVERGAEARIPFLSCGSVISEAAFLVRRLQGGAAALLALVARGVISLPFRPDKEAEAVRSLMMRYHAVSMSLADACLVRMSEQRSSSQVLTLDSNFNLHRKHGRQVIPTILPHMR